MRRYYDLTVTLEEAEPPVWRRFLLAADATFGDLHAAIQAGCGWWNHHLFEFTSPDGQTLAGLPDDEGWRVGRDAVASRTRWRWGRPAEDRGGRLPAEVGVGSKPTPRALSAAPNTICRAWSRDASIGAASNAAKNWSTKRRRPLRRMVRGNEGVLDLEAVGVDEVAACRHVDRPDPAGRARPAHRQARPGRLASPARRASPDRRAPTAPRYSRDSPNSRSPNARARLPPAPWR